MKYNSNTLQQQVVDNESAPSALAVASQAFQAVSGKEVLRDNVCGSLGGNGSANQKQPISLVPGFVRLNPDALYDRIGIQIGNVRDNGRYARCNVYLALKEDKDTDFTVFMTGAATRSHGEVYRGCKNSLVVKEVVDAMIDAFPDIMIARLRYKPVNGFITDFHKKLTKSAVIGITKEDDTYIAILSLYQEFYRIPLDTPMSKRQSKIYEAHGVYDAKPVEFEDEE